ncbi:Hsp33 family molecular chaperone HslO [Pseudoramibacter faecis]|uniref:Hsp33 family molecular chaperone HslO n=1 Tax=Pseudoramibacter faecis TaxID=3108534 RepID=UPI002E77D3E9|nr:Hsp33 family molecular chaperone HslO [Pseudoramibacter sp. HA2172]
MSDYMVMGTAADAHIRAFAVSAAETVEEARTRHQTSPVMTAALGRLLSAGAMMGAMMKGDRDVLTLQINGDGPAHGLTVTADSHGRVKGYAGNPSVDLPLNAQGKLDVGGAIGKGTLRVIRDLGLKEPYNGNCKLLTGEIAEDLAYYYNISEQTPSAVGLGVLINPDCSVKTAGGFIIQLMPDIPDEVITRLEQKIAEIESITAMMAKGMSPEAMLKIILGEMDLVMSDRLPVTFYCDCDQEKVSRALAAIGKKEMDAMIADGETIEVKCHFCGEVYYFTVDALKAIRDAGRFDRLHIHDKLA